MRRFWLLPALLLTLLVWPAASGQRLDLLPGAVEGGPADAGFRFAVAGSVALRVEPAGPDQARVTDAQGNTRTIALPPVPAYEPPPVKTDWAALAPGPRFALPMFATFIDGLSLLLTEPAVSGEPSQLRFSATVRLRTLQSRLGRCTTEVVARQVRLGNRVLDYQVERLLTAGALPPLEAKDALVDVEVVVSGTTRPMLTVFVSAPRREYGFANLTPDDGWLYQETLGLPREVRNAAAAQTALAAYELDRREALAELTARLADPQTPMLFGNWQVKTDRTWAEVCKAIDAAPEGERATLRFLGGWAKVLQRQERDAGVWMNRVANTAAVPALADEAAFLAATWARRGRSAFLGLAFAPDKPAGGAFRLESQLARGWTDPAAERFAQTWRLALALHGGGLSARPEARLLLRGALQAAAEALADQCAGRSVRTVNDLARSLIRPGQELGERLLFDAGAVLVRRADPTAAGELLRLLLEYAPTSPLAPEAAWRLAVAHMAARDVETALALAETIDREFGPGTPWFDARGITGDGAPWAAGLGPVRGPNDVRRLTLRLQRDIYGAASSDPATLRAAETAARRVLDETRAADDRADWLALGHLLWRQGRRDEARAAYANAALQSPDDETHYLALMALSASCMPDAARVAAALRDDAAAPPLLKVLLRLP